MTNLISLSSALEYVTSAAVKTGTRGPDCVKIYLDRKQLLEL